MNLIENTFEGLRQKKEMAFMPFFTLGYPSFEESKKCIMALQEGGADLVELGVPFSDPLADGPTIQKTSHTALENGMTLESGLNMVKELRDDGLAVPVVMMGYINPFMNYGIDKLAEKAKEAGVNGFIIPDLPIDEAAPWLDALSRRGINLIFFISPTTSDARMEKIISMANGFLYCIAIKGVTGARADLSKDTSEFMKHIKAKTNTPLALGFGISKPSHVASLKGDADGAIVASALFNYLDSFPKDSWPEKARKFVQSFKKETR